MAGRTSYALFARASFHGKVIEERFVYTGRPLVLGGTGSLAIPAPEGHDFVAEVAWVTPAACVVTDALGRRYELVPGRDQVLTVGEVELRLYLVERVWLARVGTVALAGSLAWFLLVTMSSAAFVQSAWVFGKRCELESAFVAPLPDVGGPLLWVGAPLLGLVAALFVVVMADQPRRELRAFALPFAALLLPLTYEASGYTWKTGEQYVAEDAGFQKECVPPEGGGGGGAMSAEYLARLLRQDYEGEQQGVIEDRIERPEAERDTKEFMPAGSVGPATKMGGAEQVASRPVRTIVEDDLSVPAKSKAEDQAMEDARGQPMAGATAKDDDSQDGVADGLESVDPEKRDHDAEAPAEEHRGWGFPEWYDERDKAMDDLEISVALRVARHRLAIDPNDGAALSILSYYQYLGQDYDAARKTYDHYIELFPDDPAGYNNKALVYKRQKEYQKEESLYRVALSLEPGDTTAMNNLGVNLAHQRRFDEALAVMRELEQTDPDDAYAELHRAKIHAEMGDDEQALTYLEKALDGMSKLDTLHHIEFRQDIRLDPSFDKLRDTYRFRAILNRYYGKDSPLEE